MTGAVAEFLGGVATDYLLRRTGNLKIARSLLIAVSWCFELAGLLPAILVHDLAIGLAGFTVALFFLGMAIAPPDRPIDAVPTVARLAVAGE